MSQETIFNIHLILGYVAWLLCFGAYVMPRLKSMDPVKAQRAIAIEPVLAIFALLTVRIRPLFWLFVVAFNLVGAIDLIFDYYHATQVGLPAMAGQLGATYAIPIIYVPLLMITHVVAFYLIVRPRPKAVPVFARDVAAAA